jgi:hypothetical protein
MFASRRQGTVIAKGLKIVGSVTAEGLVEVNGQIDGELRCTSLIISRGAHVTETRKLVEQHWPEIEALAQRLLVKQRVNFLEPIENPTS